jgi:hypothetical protein
MPFLAPTKGILLLVNNHEGDKIGLMEFAAAKTEYPF